MELAYDSHLLARILLTVATLGYGFVTIKADFNATHATNPLWTPHARFHVVWQVLSYSGIALIALGLIWIGGPHAGRTALPGGPAGRRPVRRLLPRHAGAPGLWRRALRREWLSAVQGAGRLGRWDVNVTAFTIMTAFLIAGLLAI